MKPRGNRRARRRLETWLWTGPVGHLLGGGLDVAEGMLSYLRTRTAGGGRSSR
ncbi:MAG: hypothetical protein ACHQHO_02035 [Solirubrobacterales bacterium]